MWNDVTTLFSLIFFVDKHVVELWFRVVHLNLFFSLPLTDVKNNDIVPWVLNSVLSKYIPSPNPHVRQAACIWLLSLVKKLSHHKEIQVNTLTNTLSVSFIHGKETLKLQNVCLIFVSHSLIWRTYRQPLSLSCLIQMVSHVLLF